MLKRGVCRWCKCIEERACPGGCAWVTTVPRPPLAPATMHYVFGPLEPETLCTACLPVEQAWRQIAKPTPSMRRAFFRGFMEGSNDERRECVPPAVVNPYKKASAANAWWQRGFTHGAVFAAVNSRRA